MKIPFLCNVYSAFSHIRSRSVYSLPPLFTIFPDASGSEPAIDCRWKGRQKGEDGNEAEGRDKRSLRGLWRLPGLVSLSDHAGPHVLSSLWRRCVRRCSGSAMGRDHVWADSGFLPNYRWCFWCRGVNIKREIAWTEDWKLLKWSETDLNLRCSNADVHLTSTSSLCNSSKKRLGVHYLDEQCLEYFNTSSSSLIFNGVSLTASVSGRQHHATSSRAQLCFSSTIYHFKRPNGQSADNRPL